MMFARSIMLTELKGINRESQTSGKVDRMSARSLALLFVADAQDYGFENISMCAML
jgi:hypothetical protein